MCTEVVWLISDKVCSEKQRRQYRHKISSQVCLPKLDSEQPAYLRSATPQHHNWKEPDLQIMEEPKTSKSENPQPKKNIICEESKAVKIITNQTLKPRNDKSMTETGTSSLNRNSSKKPKQNDICIEKTEVKSCKANATNVPGPKDLGPAPRDQSHCKVKKILNSPIKTQKGSSQAKAEKAPNLQAKVEKLPKSYQLTNKGRKNTLYISSSSNRKST